MQNNKISFILQKTDASRVFSDVFNSLCQYHVKKISNKK